MSTLRPETRRKVMGENAAELYRHLRNGWHGCVRHDGDGRPTPLGRASRMAAEESGFESMWVPEHLIMPVTMTGEPNTPHEGEPPISASTPAFDPWVQIATMAARTSRSASARTSTTSACATRSSPPARSPPSTTSPAGASSSASARRWLRQEWEVMQLDFDTRGRSGRRDDPDHPAPLHRGRGRARRRVLHVPAGRLPPEARPEALATDAHRRRLHEARCGVPLSWATAGSRCNRRLETLPGNVERIRYDARRRRPGRARSRSRCTRT